MTVSKEVILAKLRSTPLRTIAVDMPEWGGEVTLRELSAADSVRLEGFSSATDRAMAGIQLALTASDGSPLFSTAEFNEAMSLTSQTAIARLMTAFGAFQTSLQDVDAAKENFTDSPS